MNDEPLKDGIHRDYHPNGKLRCKFTLKNGELCGTSKYWHENGQLLKEEPYHNGVLHGVCRQWNQQGKLLGKSPFKIGTGMRREWHENGQLKSEFSYVKGELCGRFRCWDADGIFIGQVFYFNNRPISKKQYDLKARRDPSLPRFDDAKPANTLGKYVRQLQRERRAQVKLGPTAEQLRLQKWRDSQCKTETKRKNSSEALAWIRKKTEGEKELADLTRGEAMRLIGKLYSAGAKKVWVTGIERDSDGSEYSKNLIIALPKEKLKRGKIYELCFDSATPSISGGVNAAIGQLQSYLRVFLL